MEYEDIIMLSNEMILDLLVEMRKEFPNNQDYGREVSDLLDRLDRGVKDKQVKLN
jgi:hypothetical protein